MIEFGAEFHNVDHLEKVTGTKGWRLERFPEEIRAELGIPENHNGRFRAEFAQGCEIRFVTESPFFEIGLSAAWREEEVLIYCGDYLHSRHVLKPGVTAALHIERPEAFGQVDKKLLQGERFAPWVWRVQFGNGGYVHFHFLNTYDCGHRPPEKGEKPEIVWAAYGSSITCGYVSNLYSNSYVEQVAAELGYDVLNKGLSGSCMAEPVMAEYLAGLPVNRISLELGVNMLSFLEPEEFESRVAHMLRAMTEKSRAEKIFVIDMFDNRGRILSNHEDRRYRNYLAFKRIVKEQTDLHNDGRLVLFDGEYLLKSLTWLSTDLLHPSDMGHIRLGRELAEQIRSGCGR